MAASNLPDKQKAFFQAASEGRTADLQNCLDQGIPVDQINPHTFLLGLVWNTTALMYAADQGRLETVRLLLKAKADVSIKSTRNKVDGGGEDQALHFAVEHGNTEIIDNLLNAGADINAQGNWGRTPLTIAASQGNLAAVKLLLQRGAKVDVKSKRKADMSPLIAAISTLQVPATVRDEMARMLITAGADPNVTGDASQTAIIRLAWAKEMPDEMRAALCQTLLNAGAQVDYMNKNGGTALSGAVHSNYPGTVKVLVAAGADINLVFKAGTALEIARDNVQSIKNELADSSLDKEFRTSLEVNLGDAQEIVKILTAHGAKSKK